MQTSRKMSPTTTHSNSRLHENARRLEKLEQRNNSLDSDFDTGQLDSYSQSSVHQKQLAVNQQRKTSTS